MKPLPAHKSSSNQPAADEQIPSLPANHAKSNRRIPSPVNRTYPWLLLASTATAAAFCFLYITKPVFSSSTSTASTKPESAISGAASPHAPTATSLLPSGNLLPGEPSPTNTPAPADPRALPVPPSVSKFEETNLRIQHILTAEAPGGHVSRLDLEVPVLYQSRSLRWSPSEVAEARELLNRLTDYQEKSQRLRTEGAELLDAWNHLISRSIPASDLRADSPSLPANQEDAADRPRRPDLMSSQSIQIQSATE